MGRSLWKFNNYNKTLIKSSIFIEQLKIVTGFFEKYPDKFSTHKKLFEKYKKNISTIIVDRSAVIPKTYNNCTVTVYKGFKSRKLFINRTAFGFKFGEFAFTRKPFKFPLKNKTKKNFIRR